MRIFLHKNFEKRYKKLRLGEQRRFKERKALFLENEFHPLLENHPLEGEYEGYRSINVGGDLRIPYRRIAKDAVVFAAIGTHSELYS